MMAETKPSARVCKHVVPQHAADRMSETGHPSLDVEPRWRRSPWVSGLPDDGSSGVLVVAFAQVTVGFVQLRRRDEAQSS
jgi:hypothetical protein